MRLFPTLHTHSMAILAALSLSSLLCHAAPAAPGKPRSTPKAASGGRQQPEAENGASDKPKSTTKAASGGRQQLEAENGAPDKPQGTQKSEASSLLDASRTEPGAVPTISSPPDASTNLQSAPRLPQAEPSIFSTIFETLVSDSSIKKSLAALASSLGLFLLVWARKRIKTLSKRIADFKVGPRSLPDGHRKNTVLLVGIGRSGKSNLRLRILEKHKPSQPELTQRFDVRSATIAVDGGPSTTLTMCDYRGQSFLQLIRSFIEAQFQAETPLRYRDIESLILVVDLFPFQGTYKIPAEAWQEIQRTDQSSYRALEPKATKLDGYFCIQAKDFPTDEVDPDLCAELQKHVKPTNPDDPQESLPDARHLREQVALWNEAAIDAIFALIPVPPLSFVCLFVNKLDKWKFGGDANQVQQKILNGELKPLIDNLRARCQNHKSHHIEFRVIPGSAKNSNLGGLESLLIQYARPLQGNNSSKHTSGNISIRPT